MLVRGSGWREGYTLGRILCSLPMLFGRIRVSLQGLRGTSSVPRLRGKVRIMMKRRGN